MKGEKNVNIVLMYEFRNAKKGSRKYSTSTYYGKTVLLKHCHVLPCHPFYFCIELRNRVFVMETMWSTELSMNF